MANFLAVLDLYHRDKLRMRQERNFGEIELDHVEGASPYEMEEQGVGEQDLEELGFGDVLGAGEDEVAQADDTGKDA